MRRNYGVRNVVIKLTEVVNGKEYRRQVAIFVFVLMIVGMCVCCYSLWRMKEIAENNPCIACAKLTHYVCINKTDLPVFWFPDNDWKQIHDNDYGFEIPIEVQDAINNISTS